MCRFKKLLRTVTVIYLLFLDTLMKTILGLQVEDRHVLAQDVQKVLTDNGGLIKTRVGLHDVHGGHATKRSYILLDLVGTGEELDTFEERLRGLGVTVKKMVFD